MIHTHGAALRAVAAGLEARCVGPGERLYIPMPFFWTGGFGQGLLTALVAGATLLTEAEPEPARTLELLQRERATLFRGWPDQAARLAAAPGLRRSRPLLACATASLAAVLPPERRPGARGAGQPLRHDRDPSAPTAATGWTRDLPPDKFGSCGRPFEGVEVRIVDPDSGTAAAAGEQGEIWLRGAQPPAGHLRAARARPCSRRDGSYPTGRPGPARCRRLPLVLRAASTTWSRSRAPRSTRPRWRQPCAPSDEVRQAFVTDMSGDGAVPEIGALVVTEASVEDVRAAVRSRLSAFKVPTRWLLTPDPEVVPDAGVGQGGQDGPAGLLEAEGLCALSESWCS